MYYNKIFQFLKNLLIKAGRKDKSKLVPKYIIDKNNVRRLVYVRPDDQYHGKSILDIIMSFFGLKSKNDAKRKIINDYKLEGKPNNISAELWLFHLVEYFHHKAWWDNFFKTKFEKFLETARKKVKEKKEVSEKPPKTQSEKKEKKEIHEIHLTIMLKIYKLYNSKEGSNEKQQGENKPQQRIEGSGSVGLQNTEQDRSRVSGGVDSRSTEITQATAEKRKYLYNRNNPRIGSGAPIKSKGKIKQLREQIIELLNSKEDDEFTEKEKELLKQYEGAGGLNNEKSRTNHGILYEFYTPKKIVNKTWDIVKYVYEKITGNSFDKTHLSILEPSAGTGRFFHDYNKKDDIDLFEIDPISSRIAKILLPNAKVKNQAFQELFLEKGAIPVKEYKGKLYDLVIGNPPYGEYKDKYKGIGEGKDHKRYEEYFIDRGLDTLKENGLMAFVLPSRFLDSPNSPIKEKIAKKGQLITAFRLPNGIFNTTSVGTDIVIIRKTMEGGDLNDFNDGNFFKKFQNNVLGIEEIGLNQFGQQEKYVKLKPGETFDSVLDKIDLKQIEIPKPGHKHLSEITKQKIAEALKGNKNALGNRGGGRPKQGEIIEKKEEPPSELFSKNILNYDDVYKVYNTDISKEDYDLIVKTNVHFGTDGVYNIDNLSVEDLKQLVDKNIAFIDVENPGKPKVFNLPSLLRYNIFDLIDKTKKSIENLKNNLVNISNEKLKSVISIDILQKQLEYLEKIKPGAKDIEDIYLSPLSSFVRELELDIPEDILLSIDSDSQFGGNSILNLFLNWLNESTDDVLEFIKSNNLPVVDMSEIYAYVNGEGLKNPKKTSAKDPPHEKKLAKLINETKLKNRRIVAEKLFNHFINNELDKIHKGLKKQLVDEYNKVFNGYVKINYNKLPFHVNGISTTFKGKPFRLTNIQKEGSNFLYYHGSGILAYDVGVGKTLTGITTVKRLLDDKKIKRPLIVVPKATYKKWIFEIKSAFPDLKINELYNLGDFTTPPKIEDGVVSIATYEALSNMKLSPEIEQEIEENVKDLLSSKEAMTDRKKALEEKSIEEKVGKMSKVKSNVFLFNELGFDYMMVDEAHNFKNIFSNAKLDKTSNIKFNEFSDITGSTSERGLKLFYLTRYIQNKNGIVHLLTATPFTNSPIEIYNMLSLVAKKDLERMGIDNLHKFMSHFVDISNELVVTTRGTIDYKNVVKAFKDSKTLKDLINKYIDFRTAEDANIKRPNYSYIVPMLKPNEIQTMINNSVSDLGIPDLDKYANANIENIPKDVINNIFSEVQSKSSRDPTEILKQIHILRNSTLTPKMIQNIFEKEFHQDVEKEFTFPNKEIIKEKVRKIGFSESSPKIQYTAKLASKIYKARPDIGQIVYLPRGVDYFNDVVDYFNKMGIPKDAIAIIESRTPLNKREEIIKSFNDPNGKIKIVIGTDTIKEGIDLNGNTAVLYDLYLDWNPSSKKQLIGRMVRQGNRQKNTFVITPVIANTVDSSLYQKHEEKISRWGNVWEDKDVDKVFDISGIDPSDLKFDIIKNPLVLASALYKEYKNSVKSEIQFAEKELNESAKMESVFNDSYLSYRRSKIAVELTRPNNKLANVLKSNDIIKDFFSRETYLYYLEAMNFLRKHHPVISKDFDRLFLDSYRLDSLYNYNLPKEFRENLKEVMNRHYSKSFSRNISFYVAYNVLDKYHTFDKDEKEQAENFINDLMSTINKSIENLSPEERMILEANIKKVINETLNEASKYTDKKFMTSQFNKYSRVLKRFSEKYKIDLDDKDFGNKVYSILKFRYIEAKKKYDKLLEFEKDLGKEELSSEKIYEFIKKAKQIIEASKRPETDVDSAVEAHFQEIINNLQSWEENTESLKKALLFYIINKREKRIYYLAG